MGDRAFDKAEILELCWLQQFGELSPEQASRLEALVVGNVEACEIYLSCTSLCANLEWSRTGETRHVESAVDRAIVGAMASPPALPVVEPSGGLWGGEGRSFLSGWPAAYLFATVIFAVGAMIGSTIMVSRPGQFVNQESLPNFQSPISNASSIVGQISGMVDCKWAKAGRVSRQVALGATYALDSGLVEITYDTGARVILQGPVKYQVESKNGGWLSMGKLVGRVETNEAKGFTVRTPTVVVKDLGTEFGVEVHGDQVAEVCVFKGSVLAERIESFGGRPAEQQRLVAGEAVRIEPGKAIERCSNEVAGVNKFVRALPPGVSAASLDQGLVAYWSFDDPADPGKNLMGGGDLTPMGAPAYDAGGLIGGALRLHGGDGDERLLFHGGRGLPEGVPSGDASYSISAWYRIDAMPQSADNLYHILDILSWGEPDLGRANAMTVHGTLTQEVMLLNFWWNNDILANVNAAAAAGQWHHLAATYNRRGRMQYLYLDGVRIGLRAIEQHPDHAPVHFAIGCRCEPLKNSEVRFQWVEGLLDEIGIWNRELSEAEVAQLYHNAKGLNPLQQNTTSAGRPEKGGASTSTRD